MESEQHNPWWCRNRCGERKRAEIAIEGYQQPAFVHSKLKDLGVDHSGLQMGNRNDIEPSLAQEVHTCPREVLVSENSQDGP